jgi:hypothetical protein
MLIVDPGGVNAAHIFAIHLDVQDETSISNVEMGRHSAKGSNKL